MANKLTHFDPFSDITRSQPFHGLEDFFKDFRLRAALRDLELAPRIKTER